jgi:hypothetical protein
MERPFRVNEHLCVEVFSLFNHSNSAASAARTARLRRDRCGQPLAGLTNQLPLIDPVCAQGNDLIFPIRPNAKVKRFGKSL